MDVVGLVGVDEDEVERAVERADRVECRAAAQLDAVRMGRRVDVALGEVGALGVELAGDDPPARRQGRGHRQGGVAAVGPQLQHQLWPPRPHQRFQEAAFDGAGQHLRRREALAGLRRQ